MNIEELTHLPAEEIKSWLKANLTYYRLTKIVTYEEVMCPSCGGNNCPAPDSKRFTVCRTCVKVFNVDNL